MLFVGDSEAETSGPMAPLCIGIGIGALGLWAGDPRIDPTPPPPRPAAGEGPRIVAGGPDGPT